MREKSFNYFFLLLLLSKARICEREWKRRAKENIYHWSVATVLLSIVSCVSVNCGWNDCRLLSSPHNKRCRTLGKMRKFLIFAPLPSLNWPLVVIRCRVERTLFFVCNLKSIFICSAWSSAATKNALIHFPDALSSEKFASSSKKVSQLKSHQRARSLKNIFHSVFSLFTRRRAK